MISSSSRPGGSSRSACRPAVIPGDPTSGDMPPHGRDEMVAAPPVGQPGAAHLPVVAPEVTNSASVSWSKLLGVPVGPGLGRGDLVDQPAGHDQPAEPQAGCQALAGRPGVDDVLRGERLHGPDRLAVVAEFAVVVVLDQQPAGPGRPLDGLGPPLGASAAPTGTGGPGSAARRPPGRARRGPRRGVNRQGSTARPLARPRPVGPRPTPPRPASWRRGRAAPGRSGPVPG